MRTCRRCLLDKEEKCFRYKTDLCISCSKGPSILARRERRRTPFTHDWWMRKLSKKKLLAQERGMAFDLDIEFLKQVHETKNCFYCSVELIPSGAHKNSLNLDRVDNTIGYTKQNVVASCKSCNTRKGSLEMDSEMAKLMIRKIYPDVVFGKRAY